MCVLPDIPEHMPKMGNGFTRWLGRTGLWLMGWKVSGELPNTPKLMLAAAPHTSNWDFIIAMCLSLALGARFSFFMKKEAFFWPFKSLFVGLGGIPLDRHSSQDYVQQVVNSFHCKESLWLGVTPEGTRAAVDHWKTGFVRIAVNAEVPLLLASWDYSTKTFVFDKLWPITISKDDSPIEEVDNIRRYMIDKFKGKKQ